MCIKSSFLDFHKVKLRGGKSKLLLKKMTSWKQTDKNIVNNDLKTLQTLKGLTHCSVNSRSDLDQDNGDLTTGRMLSE